MELKIDKTTKLLLGAIALGLFANASDVYIDKAYANQVHKIAICDAQGNLCANINGFENIYGLITYPSEPNKYDPKY